MLGGRMIFRSSKRNDSSGFAAALRNMNNDFSEAERIGTKNNVLKTAGTAITGNTPSKANSDKLQHIGLIPVVRLAQVNTEVLNQSEGQREQVQSITEGRKNEEVLNTIEEKQEKRKEEEKQEVIPKVHMKSITELGKAKMGRRTSSQAPRAPLKKEMKQSSNKLIQKKDAQKNSAPKAIPVKPADTPIIERDPMRVEIETLRGRVSALIAKNRRLEAGMAKLKEPLETKVVERVCEANFSDAQDESKRSLFLKDKISILQNQVDILKKGLTFHKPIVYNTESLINNTITVITSFLEDNKEDKEPILSLNSLK